MSTGHVVNLHLELRADADPIEGCARGETGAERHFSGWMELTSVIEAAVEQAGATGSVGPVGPAGQAEPRDAGGPAGAAEPRDRAGPAS